MNKASRIALIVTGSLASLLAVGLLAIGALAFCTATRRRTTTAICRPTRTASRPDTRALATENLDVDLDAGDFVLDTTDLGKVRLEVESRDDKPVFVGIARTSDVERYLAGRVAHDAHGRRHRRPFDADYDDHAGDRRPVAPAARRHLGRVRARLGQADPELEIEDGDYSVVVMNADGSARSRRRRQRRRQHPVPRRASAGPRSAAALRPADRNRPAGGGHPAPGNPTGTAPVTRRGPGSGLERSETKRPPPSFGAAAVSCVRRASP